VAIIAGGRVVAAGSPVELSRAGGVEVETQAGLRTFAQATRDEVPQIVAELVAGGEAVYGVRLLRSSLEDAYVEAIEGAPRGAGAAAGDVVQTTSAGEVGPDAT